jgi:hypothetical protein
MLVRARGFAFVELIIVGVVLAVVASLVAVGGRQNRLAGGLTGSMANLKRFGEVTGNYAADCEDRFWTFSWRAGDSFSQYNDLNNAGSDFQAGANQAVDIFRRRFDPDFERINNWLAHILYSSLPLVDYLDEPLPAEWFASPGDRRLLEIQSDPYSLGRWAEVRWAFGSSYALPTAFISPDEYPTIFQSGSYNSYWVPPEMELGGRTVTDVTFPSNKAHLSETASWFCGPQPAWYLETEARVPVLTVDGSVAVRRTADANAAWNPDDPSRDDYIIRYNPPSRNWWEPRPLDSRGYSDVSGKYRWTRHGLAGVDFDGERVE